MNFGQALKSIREERKISQGVAAKKAGISQTYLSQLESNTKKSPSKVIISKLCKVYKVPPVVVSFYAVEISDVPQKNKKLYGKLKPVIDGLIKLLIHGDKHE